MSSELPDISPYLDQRREFFCKWFNNALSYQEYLNESPQPHKDKWENSFNKLMLSKEQISLIKSFERRLNILVLSGSWCGDCVRQGPMLEIISRESNLFDLRFIDNRSSPEFGNELRINGAEKVPVAVFLSEDFLEIQRFGDRHLSVYRRLVSEDNVKSAGAYCDPGIIPSPETEIEEELGEWLETIERVQHILYLSPLLKRRYR
ncbi:MAG TPA: thioredoxin family protein [Oligoflexia bacterium]|nr:thioredoxin family protein [Oligoflexia bacterium]HMP47828.1 thioredoxin family protein [Oligoflexia bacterium]